MSPGSFGVALLLTALAVAIIGVLMRSGKLFPLPQKRSDNDKPGSTRATIMSTLIVAAIGAISIFVSATLSLLNPEPTPTPASMSYQLRVQVMDTLEPIPNAQVVIEVAGQPTLTSISDSNGFARIYLESSYIGHPALLIVEAGGYEKLIQNTKLTVNSLPEVVQLEPGPVMTTPSFTPTPTATEPPLSIPTQTATPIPMPTHTATRTSTPTPDAVVNVENLNLRFGPGTNYDIVGKLKQGDWLKVTGKNTVGNWLKVIAPDGQEGWVAASLLEINLPLSGVAVAQAPPTLTPIHAPTPAPTLAPELLPPPILLGPENGAAFIGEPVVLRWGWYGPRAPNEVFSVRVRREGETRPCHHAQAIDLEYKGSLTYCTAGTHYWGVALARRLCADESDKRCWQTLSEPSAERWFYYVPGEEPWEWPTPSD